MKPHKPITLTLAIIAISIWWLFEAHGHELPFIFVFLGMLWFALIYSGDSARVKCCFGFHVEQYFEREGFDEDNDYFCFYYYDCQCCGKPLSGVHYY